MAKPEEGTMNIPSPEAIARIIGKFQPTHMGFGTIDREQELLLLTYSYNFPPGSLASETPSRIQVIPSPENLDAYGDTIPYYFVEYQLGAITDHEATGRLGVHKLEDYPTLKWAGHVRRCPHPSQMPRRIYFTT